MIAGAYITWFWADDLSSAPGGQGEAARVVDGWSASLTNWIQDNSATLGLAIGGIVVVVALSALLTRFEPTASDEPESEGGSEAEDDADHDEPALPQVSEGAAGRSSSVPTKWLK